MNPPKIPKRKLIFRLNNCVIWASKGADIMLPIIIIVIGRVEKHLFCDKNCPARPDITKYSPICAPTIACARNKMSKFILATVSVAFPSDMDIESNFFV